MRGLIFIGGSGRSGTSRLRNALDYHPHIYGIPKETRIFIAPKGLFRVVEMFNRTTNGKDRGNSLGQFEDLACNEFFKHLEPIFGDYKPRIARFCLDMMAPGADYIELSRDLMLSFLTYPEDAENKYICEKTPHTIMQVDTLWKVFPEAKVIQIKRDPREVLASWVKQTWAPNGGLDTSADAVGRYYKRWRQIADWVRKDRRYYEVKLEDLCDDPKRELEKIVDFIGCVPCKWPDGMFEWSKVRTRWREHKEHKLLTRLMQPYMGLMGYAV